MYRMDKQQKQKEDLFLERYEKLNERQQEAVNTIYGPVMVIAGPGTGKTEVLAMRIANLLRSDAQVQPQEILCLTYTDEATNSMRRRLLQITGQAAHRVNIYTFHGFCNMVIQNNSDYFSKREMQPIDDLERAELMYDIIDKLPKGHPLRKLSGDIYSDIGRLKRLFDMMKQEHYTSADISAAIDEYIASFPEREEFIYKRAYKGFKKGDLKQDAIDEMTKRMESTRAAAGLFDVYQERMREAGRYDFNDMILWVLDAFEKHPVLLQSYQERYQFILVDEFQDTNGSQNEVLNALTSYWEDPNVFVVGDDDQSIFEFQGARIKNITDFYNRHREGIKVIVLPHNYRSSQAVIDRAMASINNNKLRLINQLNELQLDKNIVAANDRFRDGKDTVEPEVRVYQNTLHEEADVVLRIEKLKQEGVPLNEIAVLYSQHKQADGIIGILERKGIPYNVKKAVNILDEPLIIQLLNVLRYLDAERKRTYDGEELLFELMHAPYFGIAANDIAKLALHMQQSRKETGILKWRMVLSNPLLIESLDLKTAPAMHRLGRCLDEWERQQLALPLPLLIEKIVHEGGVVAHLIKTTDHVWMLQVLYTFFEHVKDSHARTPRMKPMEYVQMTERMYNEGIALSLQRVIQNDQGVYFYTAHSSKGNEFEHVFLIGCTDGFWEKKSGAGSDFKLPDTLTATEDDKDKGYKEEVARRLFYVALTRARKHLYVSYATNDKAGKGLKVSMLVDEICPDDQKIPVRLTVPELEAHLMLSLEPVQEVRIQTANAVAIDRMLQQLTMSATQLTKFLRCPLTFYYETILKVPMQKRDSLAYGGAIHYALERMYMDMKANGVPPSKETVFAAFKSEMYRQSSSFTGVQFERRMEQGEEELSSFYDHKVGSMHRNVEVELKVPRYYLDGVPVTGKIDLIEVGSDGCDVVDYKTGNPDKSITANLAPPNEKAPLGGDYWRQMVFYKLLLERWEDRNWHVKTGRFEYVQKTKDGTYKTPVVPIFAADEQTVLSQLKDAYTRIMNHEYDRGCGDEKCHWCNFAKRYELIMPTDEVDLDDE